ncbi:type VII secretion protein EssB [Bacillus altitudinis]|uniref:type VII secretion protein EssB n=1 Tax=Bacillus pumilus TaxID=1408 RepID=UPI0025A00CB2|nr:type VII secretion protein EssB [Bacillus pumilus]MDM5321329.1 type VII secretion protein EssB [Bacillus pumilus]MDR4995224.1 type VII secretion protein EssB [Bacillus altitudinis]
MADKKSSYLEEQLEAVMKKEGGTYSFIFQRETIKLLDGLEAAPIKDINPSFKKEIQLTEDEVIISIQPPPAYQEFRFIHAKDEKSKWIFSYQLIDAVCKHDVKRLHPIVSPENIVFHQGLAPAFLHYGVKESIPPYETDEHRLLKEVKAIILRVVDHEYQFQEYVAYSETLKLSELAKEINEMQSLEELSALIQQKIEAIETKEKTLLTIPKKKWKIERYIGLGLLVILIPALVYTIYTFFFAMPKQEAYVEANKYYLNKQYSQVVDTLEKYSANQMPVSIQYELAISYVQTNQGNLLLDQHKKEITDTYTLQTDPQYFLFWIHIGQGNSKEALDIARVLGDDRYIFTALVAYRNDIQNDESLSAEEKQKQLDPIIKEMAKYEEKETTETSTNDSSGASQAEQKEQSKADQEKKEKESEAKKKPSQTKKDEKK